MGQVKVSLVSRIQDKLLFIAATIVATVIAVIFILVLKGVFAWTNPTQAPPGGSGILPAQFVTSLPGSPVDRQEIIYEASASNKIYWHLKYKSSIGKWVKIGGPPLYAAVGGLEATVSTSYTDLGTVLSLTAPLAGDYQIFMETAESHTDQAARYLYMAIKIGSAATSGNDGVAWLTDETNFTYPKATNSRLIKRTLSAGTVVKLQHAVNVGTGYFGKRVLTLDPIFVQ